MPSKYPQSIVEAVQLKLKQVLGAKVEVHLYAGELFDMEELERISKRVRTVNSVFVDLDDIAMHEDANADRHIGDRLYLKVYCCASNLANAVSQFQMSYTLANDVRKAIAGFGIAATNGVHSNGLIKYVGVQKELMTYGLSVHTVQLYVDFVYDLDTTE
jgi:hypothetical protein